MLMGSFYKRRSERHPMDLAIWRPLLTLLTGVPILWWGQSPNCSELLWLGNKTDASVHYIIIPRSLMEKRREIKGKLEGNVASVRDFYISCGIKSWLYTCISWGEEANRQVAWKVENDERNKISGRHEGTGVGVQVEALSFEKYII